MTEEGLKTKINTQRPWLHMNKPPHESFDTAAGTIM